jgi:hypothetical protein
MKNFTLLWTNPFLRYPAGDCLEPSDVGYPHLLGRAARLVVMIGVL